MSEPAREPTEHFVTIELRDLTLTIKYHGPGDIVLDETLDALLQGRIDAATTHPINLPGLIVLHASLRRWAKYARQAIRLLEHAMTRPGYLDDGET